MRLAITWMSRASQLTSAGTCPIAARLGGFYPMRNFRHCRHFIPITEGPRGARRGRRRAARAHPRHRQLHRRDARESGRPRNPGTRRPTPRCSSPADVCMRTRASTCSCTRWRPCRMRTPGSPATGPLDASLRALCTRLGLDARVRFLGWQAPVNPFLRTADAFVCPSRHEPHGNIVLEAWAHGCPIVATDTHGPAELIEHGRTGWLVTNEDADDMARGIARVLDDPPFRPPSSPKRPGNATPRAFPRSTSSTGTRSSSTSRCALPDARGRCARLPAQAWRVTRRVTVRATLAVARVGARARMRDGTGQARPLHRPRRRGRTGRGAL